jgi:hypothetical protein
MSVFEQAIKQILKKELKATITAGKVTKVNGNVCDVERDDLPELLDVRLNSIQKDLSSSFTIIPAEGSIVLCAIIEGAEEEAVVISCSEIEAVEVWFDAGKTKGFKLNKNGAIYDDGSNGGVVIAPTLKAQLDIMTARIDFIMETLKTVNTAALHPNPGWTAAITPTIEALPTEDFSNIENDRLTH